MIPNSIFHFETQNFDNVLRFHGIQGSRYNYEGYGDLYNLFKINQIFSSNPWGEIVDRSGTTKYPFKLHIRLPWTGPKTVMDLESACEQTVKDIVANNPAPYYIYWSGGIDSHLALISFMKVVDHKDIIIFSSEASIEENPWFYEHYIKGRMATVDSKGPSPLGGTHITGDCGDTIWAILDDDFFLNETNRKYLYRPWQELFSLKNNDPTFLDYCEEFMEKSNRPITTLFEARWWFYFLAKSQSKATYKLTGTLLDSPNINLIHFYENDYLETWSYYNTDKIIKDYDWLSYKWPAKDIIYKYDKNEDYLVNKTKGYSNHIIDQKVFKNLNMHFNMPLFITDNNERPQLETEPFWSNRLYKEHYYERYKHLFYS